MEILDTTPRPKRIQKMRGETWKYTFMLGADSPVNLNEYDITAVISHKVGIQGKLKKTKGIAVATDGKSFTVQKDWITITQDGDGNAIISPDLEDLAVGEMTMQLFVTKDSRDVSPVFLYFNVLEQPIDSTDKEDADTVFLLNFNGEMLFDLAVTSYYQLTLEAKDDAEAAATSAGQSATTATTKRNEAEGFATSASQSATTATTKRNEAEGFATSAGQSATTATTKRNEAEGFATSAGQAKTDAETAAATATSKAALRPYILYPNLTFLSGELEALKVLINFIIEFDADTAKDDTWIVNAFSKGTVTDANFNNYISLKNLATNQQVGRKFTAGEISAGYAELNISSVTGYTGCVARIWFDYSLTTQNNTYLVSGSASTYNIKIAPTSINYNSRVLALETNIPLTYTKKDYLLKQNLAFTNGELEALKVLEKVYIEFDADTAKDDTWIVNAFSKGTVTDANFNNYFSLKNLATNQQVGRKFTEGEISAGYAELNISSITGYTGCVARIWFDYSLTTQNNVYLVSGSASVYNIKIAPAIKRGKVDTISTAFANVFNTENVNIGKYVNPTNDLYLIETGAGYDSSGYINVEGFSSIAIEGIVPVGGYKSLQFSDESFQILGGVQLVSAIYIDNKFVINSIPAGTKYIFFTIKAASESAFSYSNIAVYNAEDEAIEKINNLNLKATSIADDATIRGERIINKSDLKQKMTLKYEKSYFDDLTDFTATGFSPTTQNGNIKFTGGTNDFSKSLKINGLTNSDEQIMLECVIRVGAIATTNYGVAIGKRSVNTWAGQARSWVCQIAFTSADCTISQSDGVTLANKISKLSNVAAQAGDLVRIRFIQSQFQCFFVVENIRRGTFDSVFFNNIAINVADVCLFNIGGDNDITSIRVISGTPKFADVVLIGNSKTKGDYEGQRYSRYLSSFGVVATFAGNSDRTLEAIQGIDYITDMRAKYAILSIVRNDVGSGVATATWQANYATIVQKLQQTGTIVVHLLEAPEINISGGLSQANQDLINNFLINNYGIEHCIDIRTGWDNATMLSSDNIHPTEQGGRYIAKKIKESGLIPLIDNVEIDQNWAEFLINKIPK